MKKYKLSDLPEGEGEHLALLIKCQNRGLELADRTIDATGAILLGLAEYILELEKN